MHSPLKILILEDSLTDTELVQRSLVKEKKNCEFNIAMDKASFVKALETFAPDVILSDNSLPQFDSAEALILARQLSPHIPFILVTGTVSEEFAAEIIKQGADDYILKDRMIRLPASIDAAIYRRRILKEITDYKYALDEAAIIAITDQKGIILYANDNFCNISKYSNEELVGKDHRIVNSNFHPAPYIRNLWTTIANGNIWKGELRNMSKDGRFYWVDTTIIPFLNQKGKPYQYLAIRTDITERKKAEEDLLQTQMRLTQAQQISHMGNWEVNFETNRSKWSDEAYRIYGVPPGDHNFSIEKWISFVHPADLDYVKKTLERSMATLKDLSMQHRIIRKDGSIRHVFSESKFEFNKAGKPVGLYGISHDVTERIEAEEELRRSEFKLREAQAVAKMGNWEIDMATNMHTWSDEFYRIYGLNKTETKPSAELFLSFMHPESAEMAQKKVQTAFETLTDSSFQFKFIRKDGRVRHGYTEYKFEFDRTGTPTRLYGILQDITERVETEQEIKNLEANLFDQQKKEQVRITATALAAQEKERNAIGQELHDNVNQILVGTKLILSTIKNDPANAQKVIASCMDNIQDAVNENRKIAHTLVAPDLDKKTLTEQLKQLTDDMLTPIAVKTVINVSDFKEELLDEDQKLAIYRIAQEQCTNIVKYSQAKKATITLATKDDHFKMTVADNGKGMDSAKKTDGIGLRNIKGRLSVFSGSAVVVTAEGKGFSLEIQMPLTRIS